MHVSVCPRVRACVCVARVAVIVAPATHWPCIHYEVATATKTNKREADKSQSERQKCIAYVCASIFLPAGLGVQLTLRTLPSAKATRPAYMQYRLRAHAYTAI